MKFDCCLTIRWYDLAEWFRGKPLNGKCQRSILGDFSGRPCAAARQSWIILGVLSACLISFGQFVQAEDSPAERKDPTAEIVKNAVKPSRGTRKTTSDGISAEREALLIDFARQNHPELASLMQNLKAKAPQDYQAALTDLDRTAERLLKSKDKSPEKYETQLADWKNLSRIQLLEARFALADDQSVESELRTALGERMKMKLASQKSERDRLQKRLEKLTEQINEMSSGTESMIDKQLANVRKKYAASKTPNKGKVKKSADSVPASEKESMK